MRSFHSWAEWGAWYRGLMKGRPMPDATIQAKADELTHGLTTDDAKVDALYNMVDTISLYCCLVRHRAAEPHMASEVFRDQYGDCKDNTGCSRRCWPRRGLKPSRFWSIPSVRVNEALRLPSQFDHMITLVKLKDHDVWLDSTPEVSPSRMLMAGLRDKLALAIPATGDARLIRTEAALPFPSFMHETITGKLEKRGVLTAHFDLTLRGDAEVIYRAFTTGTTRQWQELAQRISYNSGFAGDVSAVDASLPEKTAEPFHLSWDYTRKDFGDSEPQSRGCLRGLTRGLPRCHDTEANHCAGRHGGDVGARKANITRWLYGDGAAGCEALDGIRGIHLHLCIERPHAGDGPHAAV